MNVESRPMSGAEADRFNQKIPENFSDFLRFQEGKPVCDGPISIPALPSGARLVVIGDFICTGILEVPEEASLVVTGRLEAEGIIADGNIIVLGDIETGDVFGESYCNRVFCCGGNAHVRCLIENGHDFEFEGSLDALFVASLMNVVRVSGQVRSSHVFLTRLSRDKCREVLVPELFDGEGKLESDLVTHRIWKKQPLLK